MNIVCDIYKSKKNEELYLYVEQAKGLAEVPSELIAKINSEKPIMQITLNANKKLARADVKKVIAEVQEKGFYLQLPPSLYDKQNSNG